MTAINPLDEPPDLEALDTWLASEDSPPECMQLSELDGFLTGVAIGPGLLMPSQYMPTIFGDEEPVFEDRAQAEAIHNAILARYNEILRSIDAGAFEPIFWEDADGGPIATEWADGFVAAVDFDPDAWEPLLTSEDESVLLAPIMSLASGEDGRPLLEGLPGDVEGYIVSAIAHIPDSVEKIAAFWRARRRPS